MGVVFVTSLPLSATCLQNSRTHAHIWDSQNKGLAHNDRYNHNFEGNYLLLFCISQIINLKKNKSYKNIKLNNFVNRLNIASNVVLHNQIICFRLEMGEDLLMAQAAVFLQGGFETTASNLTFLSVELAHNPKVQVNFQYVGTVMYFLK